MSGKTPEQWRADVLAHLRAFPRSWFSAYDLGGPLSGRGRAGPRGRSSRYIRTALEELAAGGLADRREERAMSTPYSKSCKVFYRAREDACAPGAAPAAGT